MVSAATLPILCAAEFSGSPNHSAFKPTTRAHSTSKDLAKWLRCLRRAFKAISIWVILLVAFIGGVFSGFSRRAAPATFGCRRWSMFSAFPRNLAVGTDLFEIIISASYGTFTHAVKGQRRYLDCTGHAHGRGHRRPDRCDFDAIFYRPEIRLAFVPLPLIGAVHCHLHFDDAVTNCNAR